MKKTLLFFIVFLINSFAYSQETSPSLSLGLDQVLFGKGVIDVDLLTSIISEKQGELKNRIVEQEILRPVFENSPFVTKNYAYAVVKELMNERDKNVLKKELLEHSVNYAVVHGIAEMYLQLNWESLKKDAKTFFNEVDPTDSLNACYDLILYDPKATELKKMWTDYKQPFLAADYTGMKLYLMNKVWIKSKNSALIGNHLTNYGVPLTKVGKKFKNTADDENSSYYHQINFNHLLMDMVFHAVRNNGKFRERGFFSKPLMFDLHQYREMSTYQQLKSSKLKFKLYDDVRDFVSSIADFYESFEILKEMVDSDEFQDDFGFDKFQENLGDLGKALTLKLIRESSVLLVESVENLQTEISDQEKKLSDLLANKNKNSIAFAELIKSFEDNYLPKIDASNFRDGYAMATYNDTTFSEAPTSWEGLSEGLDETEISNYFVKLAELNNERLKIDLSLPQVAQMKEELENKLNLTKLTLSDFAGKVDAKANEGKIHKLIIEEINEELQALTNNQPDQMGAAYDSLIQNLYSKFYQIKSDYSEIRSFDFADYIQHELVPQIAFLNHKYGGKFSKVVDLFDLLGDQMRLDVYQPILDGLANSKATRVFKKIFDDASENHFMQAYLDFFRKLDKLDEMKTYYELLHDVLESGGHSANQDVANAMNIILQNLEKYTEFNSHDDRIDIDVESIILALSEKYGDRDKNPLSFLLTVGINNAFVPYDLSTSSSSNFPVANFSYASEKIGARFNLYNWKLRYSYANGEKRPRMRKNYDQEKRNYLRDPIVSNLHLLVYGSGLLYQVTKLSTATEVNSTFLGVGLGVQFYNNLNFNVSGVFPVYQDNKFKFQKGLINLGFDIYFVEYITALNKKRKQKKAEKEQKERELQNKAIENGLMYVPPVNKKAKR